MTDDSRTADRRAGLERSVLSLPAGAVSRRRFLTLAGGLALAGCTGSSGNDRLGIGDGPTTTTTTPPSTTTPAAGSVTATTVPSGVTPNDRVVVVVSLDGGNDAVNTLVPDLGSYRDLRPGLALDEEVLLRHSALPDHGLHPSLEPLLPFLDDGELALIAGVGFERPDRSHFTSIDRWDRADRMDESFGWLGRWLDLLDADLPVLGATALGGTGQMMTGAARRPSAIGDVDAFAFPADLSNGDIRALAEVDASDDPLRTAARTALATSVGAVEEFDAIADAVRGDVDRPAPGDPAPYGSGPFANGLAVAAELIGSDAGTRLVTVTANGFDTHSQQLDLHATLLADVAAGLAEFWTAMRASGDADRVLLLTTSEFGRRVGENGSAGCDHGAAGLSLVMGPAVRGGLYGEIDTDTLLDGDLAPTSDPRTLYTAALEWLGGDVDAVLGGRWTDHDLLV